jgi:hypothetical protein
MLKASNNKHVIIIIVAHEKGFAQPSEKKDWESEELPFSGLGNRFAFESKRWIRLTKHAAPSGVTRRVFLLDKSRHKPDFSITKKTVPFKICSGGIEYVTA